MDLLINAIWKWTLITWNLIPEINWKITFYVVGYLVALVLAIFILVNNWPTVRNTIQAIPYYFRKVCETGLMAVGMGTLFYLTLVHFKVFQKEDPLKIKVEETLDGDLLVYRDK